MKKNISTLVLIVVLAISNVSGVFSESNPGNMDETVYAMLKSNGSVDYMKLVTRQYGESFTGKYSQTGISSKELPVLISLKYFLDDKEVQAGELAGRTGEIKIHIGVRQNDACDKPLRDKYMAQIQLPLNLDHVKIKKFDGTSAVLAGSTETLSYAVLPGEAADFELIFDANNFEMDSIQIALVEYTSDMSAQFGGLADGIQKMWEKAGEMSDGTIKLKTGIERLSGGTEDLNGGISRTYSGTADLAKGMRDYSAGMKQYQSGLTAAAAGISSSCEALQQLNAGAAPILKGYQDMQGAAAQLSQGHSALAQLAQKLQESSKDPEVQMLCQGVIAEAEGLSKLSAGLEQTNHGLDGIVKGLGKLEKGGKVLNQGAAALPAAFGQLQTGFAGLQTGAGRLTAGLAELKKGSASLNESVGLIPAEIQKLADGQIKFRNGIKEMETKVKEGIAPAQKTDAMSIRDGKTKVNSLQFILKTPELKKVEPKAENPGTAGEKQSWLQAIWSRITDLFKTN